MTEFDKLNLRVVPIQDPIKFNKLPNYKGFPVKWSDQDNWCSWEEREDVYPGVKEWYVIPPARSTFFKDGLEIGYWVLDIDNHEGDKFKEAIAFLKTCELPPTLTIRTPSGGLHIYYFAPIEDLPAPLGRNKELDLPIEIKVSTGVVAPNGRDRKIERDLPVAYFTITEDNPIAKIAKLKTKRHTSPRKETDPNFPIEEEEFPEVGAGDRHNTMISTACSLYARGCSPDKIKWWCEEFYRRTNRKEQPNEIDNAVQGAIAYVDGMSDDADELLEEAKEEQKEIKNELEAIFPGATLLDGWDKTFALTVFSDREESKQLIKKELANVPPEDKPKLRGLITNDLQRMQETWATLPPELQHKYEGLKDAMKLLQEK